MYWRGHVGIALLAYAPAAGVARTVGEPGLAALGAAVAVACSTLPDIDHRLPVSHRGPTHTVAFAVATGALVALAGALASAVVFPWVMFPSGAESGLSAIGVAGLPAWTPFYLGGVATLSICSHVAGDAITPMGIRPFRPLSSWHVTLDVTPAANPLANRVFLGVGVAALVAAVGLTP